MLIVDCAKKSQPFPAPSIAALTLELTAFPAAPIPALKAAVAAVFASSSPTCSGLLKPPPTSMAAKIRSSA